MGTEGNRVSGSVGTDRPGATFGAASPAPPGTPGAHPLGIVAILLLLLAPTAVTASGHAYAQTTPRLELRVAYFEADDARIPSRARDVMVREVERLFRVAGIRIVARDGGALKTTADWRPATFVRVIIVGRGPNWMRLPSGVLGVLMRDRARADVVFVFVPAIRRLLASVESSSSQELLGQALGRVVVHELTHAIAPDSPHAHRGLMGAELPRQVLAAPWVTFSSHEAAALRAALSVRAAPADAR